MCTIISQIDLEESLPTHATIVEINRFLHPVRMAPYLAKCRNDPRLTLELYRWNVQLAAAFQEVLAITEVTMRNSIDAQLRTWNAAQPSHPQTGVLYNENWLDAAARPLNGLVGNAKRAARDRSIEADADRASLHPRKGDPPTHDDVLAQITFGVWLKLLPSNEYDDPADKKHALYVGREILWREALTHAFPYATDPTGHHVTKRVTYLRGLRNRVAHMESLLALTPTDITTRHNNALRLLGTISPAVRDWCSGVSRVQEVARACPV